MFKFLGFFLVVLSSIFINVSDTYALSVNDLYGNVTSTSSTANDLVNYAINYDTFLNSDFVIFQNGQYEYYIVWGDLTSTTNKITGSEVEFIKYYRDNASSGYNYTTYYAHGTDSSFTLNLNNYSVVSNIGIGFTNETYRIYKFNDNTIKLLILLTGFIFAILVKTLRRNDT